MKNYFLFFFSLTLISCSSYKIEKSVFNDFLNQQISSKKNITNIYLVEEAESKLKALEYYETAYNEKKKSDYFNRKIVANDINFNAWPIDSLEITYLKNTLLSSKDMTTPMWKNSDFNKIKLSIKKHDLILKDISTGSSSLNMEAFIISKPLISRDKKNALIFYSSFDYFNGGETKNKVVLLKKTKGKWIIITYFYDPKIMN